MTDPVDGTHVPGNGAQGAGSGADFGKNRKPESRSAHGPDRNRATAQPGRDATKANSVQRSENQAAPSAEGPNGGVSDNSSNSKKSRKRRRRKGGRRNGAQDMRQNAGDKPLQGERGPRRKPQRIGAQGAGERRNESGNGGERTRPNGVKADSGGDRSGAPPYYAALDLGTNNCRLLVALPTKPGQFRVVDAFSRIVRLGEGLGSQGKLSDNAMDRAIDALKVCAHKLDSRPIRRSRLIATEACRAAANGTQFLERVRSETGLELEIVDRETEARLAVSGCSSLVERETDGVVLFDIGGGSSEIAVIDLSSNRSNRLANHIAAWTSLPVGVVTLSERHGGREVTPAIFSDMVEEVSGMLDAFLCPDLPGCSGQANGVFHLLGTSGTVTTLAGVHLNLPRYDRRRVDGLWLSNNEVDLMMQKLLSWDFDQRSSNPCIGADRADLVLAGCAILEAIRRRWPSERLRVADRGLREGLLTEMMAADGIWRRGKNRRSFYRRGKHHRNGGREASKADN